VELGTILDQASEKFVLTSADSGLQLDLEIALSGDQRRFSPSGFANPAEEALTSGDVIEGTFTSAAECRI